MFNSSLNSAVNRQQASNCPMPSGANLAFTFPSSGGKVTAPANGWLVVGGNATQLGGVVSLQNQHGLGNQAVGTANGFGLFTNIPVKTGDEITVYYNAFTPNSLRFFYAMGEI
jgi:hypothetical protein